MTHNHLDALFDFAAEGLNERLGDFVSHQMMKFAFWHETWAVAGQFSIAQRALARYRVEVTRQCG